MLSWPLWADRWCCSHHKSSFFSLILIFYLSFHDLLFLHFFLSFFVPFCVKLCLCLQFVCLSVCIFSLCMTPPSYPNCMSQCFSGKSHKSRPLSHKSLPLSLGLLCFHITGENRTICWSLGKSTSLLIIYYSQTTIQILMWLCPVHKPGSARGKSVPYRSQSSVFTQK